MLCPAFHKKGKYTFAGLHRLKKTFPVPPRRVSFIWPPDQSTQYYSIIHVRDVRNSAVFADYLQILLPVGNVKPGRLNVKLGKMGVAQSGVQTGDGWLGLGRPKRPCPRALVSHWGTLRLAPGTRAKSPASSRSRLVVNAPNDQALRFFRQYLPIFGVFRLGGGVQG